MIKMIINKTLCDRYKKFIGKGDYFNKLNGLKIKI